MNRKTTETFFNAIDQIDKQINLARDAHESLYADLGVNEWDDLKSESEDYLNELLSVLHESKERLLNFYNERNKEQGYIISVKFLD